jgi:hypothetical protein
MESNYTIHIVHPCIHKETKDVLIMSKTTTGIHIGNVIAILISWTAYKSIGWAILHGLLGWVYVIYHLIRYGTTLIGGN